MTRDDLYPVIDEVLSERMFPYMNAGSYWIEQSDGDVQLCTYELAEALCDALCKAVGDLTAERDASRLIISDLTAEVERLRAAGDAMAEALDALCHSYCGSDDDADLVDAWQEARRG